MGYNQAYTAYQKTNVTTASQGRLVVLLYEAAVKNLNSALALLEEGDKIKPGNIEAFGKHIQKTQAIIAELECSLDMEKGGEIAQNLMSLYLFFNKELTEATFNHSSSKIQPVLKMLNDLLSAWRTASNSTSNAPASSSMQTSTFSIEG
ncbi:MAG: flagellar export chaperone FliS [Treponema sp.]|nr:flagellar export chaperone FliS [Treponema sp.]